MKVLHVVHLRRQRRWGQRERGPAPGPYAGPPTTQQAAARRQQRFCDTQASGRNTDAPHPCPRAPPRRHRPARPPPAPPHAPHPKDLPNPPGTIPPASPCPVTAEMQSAGVTDPRGRAARQACQTGELRLGRRRPGCPTARGPSRRSSLQHTVKRNCVECACPCFRQWRGHGVCIRCITSVGSGLRIILRRTDRWTGGHPRLSCRESYLSLPTCSWQGDMFPKEIKSCSQELHHMNRALI